MPNNDGLPTLLTEKHVQIGDIAYRMPTKGSFVITSGVIPPNSSELLVSKKMSQLMKELEEVFDLIIFDLSAIIAVTDAQVMASKVNGTILSSIKVERIKK